MRIVSLPRALTPLLLVRTQKDDYSPPFEAIRALVTDRYVLSKCFASSEELRGMLVQLIYSVLSLWMLTQHGKRSRIECTVGIRISVNSCRI